jgi:HAD superfamily hydrolase (TIGR01450 family)
MKNFGIVFDVDGVLYRDHHPIPGAEQVLKKLQEKQIPFIFLTNATGYMEKEKIKIYEKILNNKFEENQLILAHTPLKSLEDLKKHRTLVVGTEKKECEILKKFTLYSSQNFKLWI